MRYSELNEARQPRRRYRARSTGFCVLYSGARKGLGVYDTGIVTTGKPRVYAGVYVRIVTPQGGEFVAGDTQKLVEALRGVSMRLFVEDGWMLQAIGLDTSFSQSPMSFGTPWGYHPYFNGAVHMLEPPYGHITIGGERDSRSGR